MSNTAISVEGLSKLYRIGLAEERHESLLSASIDAMKRPLKNFRKLWRLDTSRSGAEEEADLIWALRDASFEVSQGEVLGVIGRNGAGKSTLLKILSRVTCPTAGRVVVHGRVSSLLEVGTGFHPELTGRDNIYLNGTILGMTRREIDRKFEEIVEFSGISRFLDTPIKRYSSGMKVRLAFSVAAHLDPEVLIVDEVLAVGDLEFQQKCMSKMRDLSSDRDRTVLFVSHNLGAHQALCDRGIVLSQGQLNFDGPISEAINFYLQSNTPTSDRQSLLEVTNRRGSGEILIKDIRFIDAESGTELLTFIPGRSVRVEIGYLNRSDSPMSEVEFSIGFRTMHGQKLTELRSGFANRFFEAESGEGVASCTIPRWPLSRGHYYYHCQIHAKRQLIDLINPVGQIEVERGDFYQKGGRLMNEDGMIFADFDWSLTDQVPVELRS